MDILGARRSIEQKLLMQSVALMALVAVSGTIMGIVTGSSAVLLGGVFSFVDVVIKIMMLMTAKLVARETSKRFQFGFWQFEPLVLAVEGFIYFTYCHLCFIEWYYRPFIWWSSCRLWTSYLLCYILYYCRYCVLFICTSY